MRPICLVCLGWSASSYVFPAPQHGTPQRLLQQAEAMLSLNEPTMHEEGDHEAGILSTNDSIQMIEPVDVVTTPEPLPYQTRRLVTDLELKHSMGNVYDLITGLGQTNLRHMLQSTFIPDSPAPPNMLLAQKTSSNPPIADQIAILSVVMSYAIGELVSLAKSGQSQAQTHIEAQHRSLRKSPLGWGPADRAAGTVPPMFSNSPFLNTHQINALNTILSQLSPFAQTGASSPMTPFSAFTPPVTPAVLRNIPSTGMAFAPTANMFPVMPTMISSVPSPVLPNMMSVPSPPLPPNMVYTAAPLPTFQSASDTPAPATMKAGPPAPNNVGTAAAQKVPQPTNVDPVTAAAKFLVAHLAASEENRWLNVLLANNPAFAGLSAPSASAKRLLLGLTSVQNGATSPADTAASGEYDRIRLIVENLASRIKPSKVVNKSDETSAAQNAAQAMAIVRALAPTFKTGLKNYQMDQMFPQTYLEASRLLLKNLDDINRSRVLTELEKYGDLNETSFNDLYLNNPNVDGDFKPAALLLTRLRSALNVRFEPVSQLPIEKMNNNDSYAHDLTFTEKALRNLIYRIQHASGTTNTSAINKYRELRRNALNIAVPEDAERPFRWFPPPPPTLDSDFQGENWSRYETNLRQRVPGPFKLLADHM